MYLITLPFLHKALLNKILIAHVFIVNQYAVSITATSGDYMQNFKHTYYNEIMVNIYKRIFIKAAYSVTL